MVLRVVLSEGSVVLDEVLEAMKVFRYGLPNHVHVENHPSRTVVRTVVRTAVKNHRREPSSRTVVQNRRQNR